MNIKPLAVGDKFTHETRSPWHAGELRGTEVISARCIVTATRPGGFSYEVVEILSVVDPLISNPEGAIRVGGTGGMINEVTETYCTQIRRADRSDIPAAVPDPSADWPKWRREFSPDFAVPDVLSDDPELDDISWHNDVSPSFTVRAWSEAAAASGENGSSVWPDLRVWCQHPQNDQRECPEPVTKRFLVFADGDECIVETDDVTEAVDALKTAARRMLERNRS